TIDAIQTQLQTTNTAVTLDTLIIGSDPSNPVTFTITCTTNNTGTGTGTGTNGEGLAETGTPTGLAPLAATGLLAILAGLALIRRRNRLAK
ncbi:LPXTG cell wall anchor domain-containing protein, partial [Microlunatus endophyticus]|uniref:LPXTG cell wall anchor domain-containing protein n=1 Tax=Microlunatus endophyticus TaxID=1716077 RepID=UPI00166A4B35